MSTQGEQAANIGGAQREREVMNEDEKGELRCLAALHASVQPFCQG